MTRSFLLNLLILLLVSQEAFAQNDSSPAARFMFYNVENFFDIHDDTLTDDDEFLPEGERRWTLSRYRNKINSLYKVIVYAGNPEPPALIGLCEVENRTVLNDLIYKTPLSDFKYSVVHEDSDDPRGIDVALIYRSEKVRLIDYIYLFPGELRSMNVSTRSILYCRFLISGDTLHLILNHWPSRRGGVLAGDGSREAVSDYVKQLADSVVGSHNGKAGIIISGDFNATPADNVISNMIRKKDPGNDATLVNLSDQREMNNRGTYRYRGTWENIDQVIVSEYLVSNRDGIYTDYSFLRILDPEFLLERDDTYPGMKPFSTYGWYVYRGGFSDHLPVILDLRLK